MLFQSMSQNIGLVEVQRGELGGPWKMHICVWMIFWINWVRVVPSMGYAFILDQSNVAQSHYGRLLTIHIWEKGYIGGAGARKENVLGGGKH